MGLTVGVNTHSHIKKGARLFWRISSGLIYLLPPISAACVIIVPLQRLNAPTFNATAYNVGMYTLDCNRSTTVPLRSFKRPTLNAAAYNVSYRLFLDHFPGAKKMV